MSDELSVLRRAVQDLATDPVCRTDEEWYDELWVLLDPVIDARAERQLAAAKDLTQVSPTSLLRFIDEA